MLNITLRTLLHVKPFRLIICLVESLRLSKDLELLRVVISLSIMWVTIPHHEQNYLLRQAHFILEIRPSFRLISYWKRLRIINHSILCKNGVLI